MLEKTSIIDRLEIYANEGETSAPLKLWGAQITSLRKGGFQVEVLKPTDRYGEYNCTISWDFPTGHQASYMLALSIDSLSTQAKSFADQAKDFADKANERTAHIKELSAHLSESLKVQE